MSFVVVIKEGIKIKLMDCILYEVILYIWKSDIKNNRFCLIYVRCGI